MALSPYLAPKYTHFSIDLIETAGLQEDGRFYKMDLVENVSRTETEGGYVLTRPKHHRSRPVINFKTGFTDIASENRAKIDLLYVDHGMHSVFVWNNPWDDGSLTNYQPLGILNAGDYFVRFSTPPRYVIKLYGPTVRWDVELSMTTV